MNPIRVFLTALAGLLALSAARAADDNVVAWKYAASDRKGELAVNAEYRLWLPPLVKSIRGVIIHQHGCGDGAEKGGETAAFDWHWRALAARHDCALLGPVYRAKGDCGAWNDPDRGSAAALIKALTALGEETGHPELARAPWALWGHSGGAGWAYRMMEKYPERTVAVFLRSGRPLRIEPGQSEGRLVGARDSTRVIPIVCNVGVKERDDPRFGAAWRDSLEFVTNWRRSGALVAFTPDPKTGHECGASRYFAIPFLDACLTQRLPDPSAAQPRLRPMDPAQAWLGWYKSAEVIAADSVPKEKLADAEWLPTGAVAAAWRQYVQTGGVEDTSRPEKAPAEVKADQTRDGAVLVTWTPVPDFDSGVRTFIIFRDGVELARIQPVAAPKYGPPQLQSLSYHDTPEVPYPEPRYIDKAVKAGQTYRYEIVMLNGFELPSPKSGAAVVTVK